MSAAAARKAAPKRCALYIRVSTAMQCMDGWSLDAQRDSLTRTAQHYGWKVVGVYADEGKSARKRLKDRREIFRLLNDVRAGKIDVILFRDLDRWFRNVSDFYKVQDVLDENGVYWASEKQPNLDMTTKEGRLAANILLSVGQNEADSTSDRIKYTNKFLREQHRWTSGKSTLPRCYTLGDEQRVIIDQEQAPFVLDLIAGVKRYHSVRRALIEANAAHGQSARYNNVMSLLHNPMLYGEYMGVEGFVEEPLISKAEFNEIQSCMKRQVAQQAKAYYIFTGLLKCGTCGLNLAGMRTIGWCNKEYHYYRCQRAYNEKVHACRLINEERIEAALLVYVREAVADKIAKVESVKQERQKRKPINNRAQIERKLDRLEDLYINSDRMTREKYEEKKAQILAQLIEEEPEPNTPSTASLKQIQALLNKGFDAVYYGFTPEEKRLFWRGILNSATLDTEGHITSVDFKA